ncbi:hypothetical protein AB0L06_41710 [Spirillospora sp. NPDC052269]
MQESSGLVLVEAHQFTLQEIAELQGPEGSPPALGERLDFIAPFLYVISPGEDHYPQVTLQLWEQEPGPVTASWSQLGQIRARVDGDVLEAWAVTQGPSQASLTVRPGWYWLRIYCRGSKKVQGRTRGFPEGLEQFMIQVWPA